MFIYVYDKTDIWDKVFKNGPRKICGRQPLRKFTWSMLEYFVPYWRNQYIELFFENVMLSLNTSKVRLWFIYSKNHLFNQKTIIAYMPKRKILRYYKQTRSSILLSYQSLSFQKLIFFCSINRNRISDTKRML